MEEDMKVLLFCFVLVYVPGLIQGDGKWIILL